MNNLREQVNMRLLDYNRLINSQYELIDMYCRQPIVEWDEFSAKERQDRRERITAYIKELMDRSRLLKELIIPLDKNYN